MRYPTCGSDNTVLLIIGTFFVVNSVSKPCTYKYNLAQKPRMETSTSVHLVTRTRCRSPIPSSSSIPSRGLPRHVEAPVSEYEGKTDGNLHLSPTGHKGPVSLANPVFVIQNLPGCPEAGQERRILEYATYTCLNLENRHSHNRSG